MKHEGVCEQFVCVCDKWNDHCDVCIYSCSHWPFFANFGKFDFFGANNRNCVSKFISMDEKMSYIARDNDFNQDGLVKIEDFVYDLNNNYDTNGQWCSFF